MKSLLAGTDIKIVAEASTGEQAVRLALKHEPDVVLLDIRMPEGDGLNALGRIKLDRGVPLPHPRHYAMKTTPAFAQLKAELTEAVRAEVIAAAAAAVPARSPRAA